MMGCMSSKLVSRSLSLNEERRQSFSLQRTANGIPLFEDLIISSGNGSDQYLALVCAANEVVNRLQHSRSFNPNRCSRSEQKVNRQIGNDVMKRSASYHWIPDHITPPQVNEKSELSSSGSECSRSYHTLQELDAMVNKNCLSKPPRIQEVGLDKGVDNIGSNERCDIEESQESCLIQKEKGLVDDDSSSKETGFLDSEPDSKEVIQSLDGALSSTSGLENKGVIPSEASSVSVSGDICVNNFEKGFKRKAAAKRLESLRVPSSKDSPAISSFKGWFPVGGIYSPGSYVTPKFGSYAEQRGVFENKSSDNFVFSPEMVAVFERGMQQLQEEEENLLKQIVESPEEEQLQVARGNSNLHKKDLNTSI